MALGASILGSHFVEAQTTTLAPPTSSAAVAAAPAASTTTPAEGAPVPAPAPSAAPDNAPLRNAADPIASYTLSAKLHVQSHEVRATGTITWKNASIQPVRELYLHLYLNAFKNDRTLFARTLGPRPRDEQWGFIELQKLVWREENTDLWLSHDATSPGDPDDETDIRVPLPKEVLPGETIHLDMEFVSRLPGLASRTGFVGTFHMVAQWFPKLARLEPDGRWAHFPFHARSEFYADFGTYDVTIDTPTSNTVGATGVLSETHIEGERTIRRFVQENVHDFVFTAWEGYQTRIEEADGVTIECLFPANMSNLAAIEIETARGALSHMERLFGPYPHRKLTIVHPPVMGAAAGGMEYPTLITTGGAWYLPVVGTKYIELVTIHELAHQWFQGVIASNEYESPFLDEGLASYAEAVVAERMMPNTSVYEAFGVRIGEPAWHRFAGLDAPSELPLSASAPEFVDGGDYGALVYHRTATVLLTFARVYGQEQVERALGLYARRFRFGHPKPDDLVAAFRDVLGESAAANLRIALFDRGWVDYSVKTVRPTAWGPRQGVFGKPNSKIEPAAPANEPPSPTEIVVQRRGSLALPVIVEVDYEGGASERIPWTSKEMVGRLRVGGERRVIAVLIDPDATVLLDPDLGNNAWGPKPRWISPRVFERASLAAGAAMGALSP